MHFGFAVRTIAIFCATLQGASAQEHCEPPRVDYVTECQSSVDCLNKNYHKIEDEIEERLRLKDKMGRQNLVAFQKSYELETRYRKAFCRAALEEQVISWHMKGAGPPADSAAARKIIAATCNVKVLAEFLYGLKGGLYCVEE